MKVKFNITSVLTMFAGTFCTILAFDMLSRDNELTEVTKKVKMTHSNQKLDTNKNVTSDDIIEDDSKEEDPIDVIYEKFGVEIDNDDYEDESDEDEDDDDFMIPIDEDDDDLDSVTDSIVNSIAPDGSIMLLQPVEDDDDDIDFEKFDYHIPSSTKIRTTNDRIIDFEDAREYVRQAKEYYLALLHNECEKVEGLEDRSIEEVNATSTDFCHEMEGQDVMDYLVMIDPYDLVNRKTMFGDKAPEKLEMNHSETEDMVKDTKSSEESDSIRKMIDIKNIETYEDFRIVERKLFSSKDTSNMLRNFLSSCQYSIDNNYEGINDIIDEFNTLLGIVANSIKSGQKINRRSWINRFNKVFNKTKTLISSIEEAPE